MPSIVGMVKQFEGDVEAVAGPEVRREVMAGSESLKASSSPEKIALWMRDAVARLEAAAGDEAGTVMDRCGVACAGVNHAVTDRARARRAKFEDEEAFLAAEIRKPSGGTRLEREGDILYQIYTPTAFSHPMRCYCGLMKGLPAGVEASPAYCQCSRAFVRTFWSEVLGRPVEVEVLETALTGSTECRFKIGLSGERG